MTTRAKLVENWNMSSEQRTFFWRLWKNACAWQGWNKLSATEQNEHRHAMLAALGFKSVREVNSTDEFDRLKSHLLALAGIVENAAPDAGSRRRLLSSIGAVIVVLETSGYSSHSINTILFNRFKIVRGILSISDLDTHQLKQLLLTLTARLDSWNRRQSSALQDDPPTPGTVPAEAVQTLCSTNAADLPGATPDLFFHGS